MLQDSSIKSPSTNRKSSQYLAQVTMDRLLVTKEATILGSKGVITCFILNNEMTITNNFSLKQF